MLYIYNTVTKQKELFRPNQANKVGLYVCGMTVYDNCHLGHARIFICFDVIVRHLRALGYEVTYVRNITDIDDKIIQRAEKLQVDVPSLTQVLIDAMHADEQALGVLPPTFEPRVTQHIAAIITMVQTLLDQGYAYSTPNGDVYFNVSNFPSYGNLTQQNLAALKNNVRIEPNELKHHALDFALWKHTKPEEPAWDSPWGPGRPGWHIECSAMAKHFLGAHFDIHGGGADLQFPHHENERAQSEAANGCTFANYWMHVGFVQINKEKMSKSLGNICTIQTALQQFHPEIIRYFMLSSHYRSPINYSNDNLIHAKNALQKLYLTLRSCEHLTIDPTPNEFTERFFAAMNDDFNTTQALAVLFDVARNLNRNTDTRLGATLLYLGSLLGILQANPTTFLQTCEPTMDIEALITARNLARQQRNWALADSLREQLTALGILLEDTPTGTIWRKP